MRTLFEQQESIIQKQREQDLLISELQASLIEKQQLIDNLIETEKKKKNIEVVYVVPAAKMNDSINVSFANDFNTKDIQIHIHKIDEDVFNDLIRTNPNYLPSFDVVMLGVNGYDAYLHVNDEFLAILAKYRDDGGHLLFLHDFNSAEYSLYKKPVQPFSGDLGFRGTIDSGPLRECQFVPNKCDELRKFPFEIKNQFVVTETHETPAYDPNYTIISPVNNDQIHFYCENSEKRIGDSSMGHNPNINLEEKKLLYNILYHLSQLP